MRLALKCGVSESEMQNSISFSIESIIARKDPPRSRVSVSFEQDNSNRERHASVLRLSGLINHSESSCVTDHTAGPGLGFVKKVKTQENGSEELLTFCEKSPDINIEDSFVQQFTG